MSIFRCGCVASSAANAIRGGAQVPRCAHESLICVKGDVKYDHIEELRELMRRDSRFEWASLPTVEDSCAGEILVRQKGVAAAAHREDDAQLRLLVESDSIPQYVWPAASPLQQWIVAHSNLFAGKTVLELGCGTGIIGFTVARYAKLVVLTDCSAVSLAMTLESLEHNNFDNCRVAALSWGRGDQIAHVKEVCCLDAFDVVIGSDIFYFASALKSGLVTARSALTGASSRDALFVCGSVARSERMESDLDEVPGQEGFERSSFVAEGSFNLYCWKLATK